VRPDAETEHFGLSPWRLGVGGIELARKPRGEYALTMVVRHKDERKESYPRPQPCPIIQKWLFWITTIIMTSATDIRSVLSVPDPTPGLSQQPQKKPAATSRRPQGISRELYELIGDSVPSVVPQQSKARLKLKPNLGSGPPRSRW